MTPSPGRPLNANAGRVARRRPGLRDLHKLGHTEDAVLLHAWLDESA